MIKIINLKRRPDRLENIIKQCEKLNITNYDIFEAIDGYDLSTMQDIKKYVKKDIFEGNNFNYKSSVIGCLLSHYLLWKELYNDDKYYYYVILEDDAILYDNFVHMLNMIKVHIISKHLIFLGYLTQNNINNKPMEFGVFPLNRHNCIGGTHAYVVTKVGVAALLSYINLFGAKYPVDDIMLREQNLIPVYEIQPHIAYAEWDYGKPNNVVDTSIHYDTNFIDITEGEYVFIKGLDQLGYTMVRDSISNYKKHNAVAFNTLGHFKNNLTKLVTPPYFNFLKNDGIFIHKKYLIIQTFYIDMDFDLSKMFDTYKFIKYDKEKPKYIFSKEDFTDSIIWDINVPKLINYDRHDDIYDNVDENYKYIRVCNLQDLIHGILLGCLCIVNFDNIPKFINNKAFIRLTDLEDNNITMDKHLWHSRISYIMHSKYLLLTTFNIYEDVYKKIINDDIIIKNIPIENKNTNELTDIMETL